MVHNLRWRPLSPLDSKSLPLISLSLSFLLTNDLLYLQLLDLSGLNLGLHLLKRGQDEGHDQTTENDDDVSYLYEVSSFLLTH